MTSQEYVKRWINSGRVDSTTAEFAVILHRLARPEAEAVKVSFDQQVKDRRLALLKQIADLDEAARQFQTHWVDVLRRRKQSK